MKLLVLIGLLVVVVAEEPINVYNYHLDVGVPQAHMIKQAEEAQDFDGARIVGGSPSPIGVHTFLAGLVITLTTGQTSVCGASLLSNTKAITAAHCWWDGFIQARSFNVVLGTTSLFSGGTRVDTNRVEMHANYNPYNANNDLAIITFEWVEYTNYIQRIVPATGTATYAGLWATTIGYGRTSDTAAITQKQVHSQVTVQVLLNTNCQVYFGTWVVVAGTLCTSGAGGAGLCQGSTGGPLVSGSGADQRLIGVASFYSHRGCQLGLPSGFVRVTSFLAWINARL